MQTTQMQMHVECTQINSCHCRPSHIPIDRNIAAFVAAVPEFLEFLDAECIAGHMDDLISTACCCGGCSSATPVSAIPVSTSVIPRPSEIDYMQFARDYIKWAEEMTRHGAWNSEESQQESAKFVGILYNFGYISTCKSLVYALLDIVFGGVECKEKVLAMLTNDECSIAVSIPHAILPEVTCYTICFSPTLECLTDAQRVATGANSVTIFPHSDNRKRFSAHILLNCSMTKSDRITQGEEYGNDARIDSWLWGLPSDAPQKHKRHEVFLWMVALLTARDSPGSPPPSSKEQDEEEDDDKGSKRDATVEGIEKMKIKCLEDALRVSTQRNALLTKMLHTKIAVPDSISAQADICQMADTHADTMERFVEETLHNLDETEKIISAIPETVQQQQQQPAPALTPPPPLPEQMEEAIEDVAPPPLCSDALDPNFPTLNTIREYYVDKQRFKDFIDNKLNLCCDTLETLCSGLCWMTWHNVTSDYNDMWEMLIALVVSVISRTTNTVVTMQYDRERGQKKPHRWDIERSNKILNSLVVLGDAAKDRFRSSHASRKFSGKLKRRYSKLCSSITTAFMSIRTL